MAIKAVVFDVGGVLETVGDVDVWLDAWRLRLGLESSVLDDRMARIDPRGLIGTGEMTEAAYRQRYVDSFDLSETDADAFLADMWDWYCGELDVTLVEYARGLRPAYRTAILSNSADGARREEQARHQFEQLVDTIVYSHEVGLAKPDPKIYQLTCDRLGVQPQEMVFLDDTLSCVEAASCIGIHAIHHLSTSDSVEQIEAVLADAAA